VTNLRGFSTNAVAEQALSIAFSLARRLPLVIRDGWKTDFEKYRGVELSDKKAGIIGLGRIGTRIAEMAQAFGMETLYWSRSTRDERFAYLELVDLIRESDVLFYTLAKNDETLHLLSPELLAYLKKTVLFVSIAHIDHALFVSLAEE
jgi:D-3-phosphoglycerate dehydrogenase / 2-oxoglutarate reductase